MTFSSDRVTVTAGLGTVPAVISGGYGFMANGSLAIDTDVPAGNNYDAGIRMSAAGAVYGTITSDPSDVIVNGLRITQTGAVVYESAATTLVVNGNPLTANGRLAVI